MGRKLRGALRPFWGGELGPHLTLLCRSGRGLPSYLDPLSHLATTDMGRKLGEALCPFGEGDLDPHPTQCGQG